MPIVLIVKFEIVDWQGKSNFSRSILVCGNKKFKNFI